MGRRGSLMVSVALAAPLALLAAAGSAQAAQLPLAPDFTLALMDGKVLTLADLRGKPVLLNFWRGG